MPAEDYIEFLKSRGLTFHPIAESEVNGIVELLREWKTSIRFPASSWNGWCVNPNLFTVERGGELLHPGDSAEDMWLLFEGKVEAYVNQNGQKKVQATTEPGVPSGYLPFSRMKISPVVVEVVKPVRALSLHKSRFHELVAKNYELTEAIVHSMTDRVRHFSAVHFQNEKLMSLGKLSAGLAHELNNPAAAIVRSAEDLKSTLGSLEENLESITSIELEPSQIAVLRPLLEKSKTPAVRLPLLERKRREQEITGWLEGPKLREMLPKPCSRSALPRLTSIK